MATVPHKRNPAFCDWRHGWTGRPAISGTLGRTCQAASSHMINWRFNGTTFQYTGLWNETNNPNDGTYYVILSGPSKADAGTRNLCISHMGWPTAVDDAIFIKYTEPGGAAVDIFDTENTGGYAVATSSRLGDQVPMGNLWIHYYTKAGLPITWSPNGSDYFRVAEIEVQNYQVAALTVFEVPPGYLSDTQEQITANNVATNEPIMGYNGSDMVSFGGLHDLVGDGADHVEGVERIGRRCLWQNGHPVGLWTNSTSYADIYEENVIVRARDLIDPTGGTTPEIWCRPAFVVSNTAAGAKIKVTNTSTADTWEWTASGANTAALIDYSDGTPNTGVELELGQYTEMTIEYDVGAVDTEDLTIHTASLWEGPQWGTTP